MLYQLNYSPSPYPPPCPACGFGGHQPDSLRPPEVSPTAADIQFIDPFKSKVKGKILLRCGFFGMGVFRYWAAILTLRFGVAVDEFDDRHVGRVTVAHASL